MNLALMQRECRTGK